MVLFLYTLTLVSNYFYQDPGDMHSYQDLILMILLDFPFDSMYLLSTPSSKKIPRCHFFRTKSRTNQ
jgi:hypothetical protein